MMVNIRRRGSRSAGHELWDAMKKPILKPPRYSQKTKLVIVDVSIKFVSGSFAASSQDSIYTKRQGNSFVYI
jgi:hypothetical protein